MKITKILIAMLMVSTGLFSILTVMPTTNGLPPATGNWVVNTAETVTGGSYNVTNGNIVVQRGGTLTLDGTTIIMNDTGGSGGTQYFIEVQPGGTLIMKNDALIRVAQNGSNYYYFYLRQGSKATITDSNISDAGAPSWANWQQQGIFIQSSDVTIDKTEITRGTRAIIISDCSPKITNNTIFRNDAYGIDIDRGAPYIYKNTIVNNGAGPPNWMAWHGINIYNSKAIIANNDIRSNGWHPTWETQGWGIWAQVSNITITNNTVQANGGGGIGLENHVSGTVADNILTDNDDIGFYILDASDPLVVGNSVRSPLYHGLQIGGFSTPYVKDNSFNTTDNDAIHSDGMSSPTFENNDIVVWQDGAGIYMNNNGAPVLRSNSIYTQNSQGVVITDWVNARMDGDIIDSNGPSVELWDFSSLSATDLTLTSRNSRGINSGNYCELYSEGGTITSRREGVTVQGEMIALLKDMTISANQDMGVEIWGRSDLDIQNVDITSLTAIGLYVTDSTVDIVNSSITAPTNNDIRLGNSNLVTPGLVRALNTTFNESDVGFDNDYGRLNVSWYAERIWAEWQNTRRVPGAVLVISNIHDQIVFNGTLDKDGEIEWLPVQEYTQNRTLRDDYTRHNFSASMNGVSAFAGANVNKNVNVRIILQDLVNDPVLDIANPVQDGLYNTSMIKVNGTAADPESGIYQVTVWPQGKAQQLAKGQELWHEYINLTDGKWTIQVNATNYAGVTQRETVTITVDTVPPVLVVDYPHATELVNTTELNVVGRTEPGAFVTVNGLNATVDANGNFTRNITLPEGVNTIIVASNDKALNFNFSMPVVTVDITPPPLTVFTPVEGLITPDETIIATGSVEDGATLSVDGSSILHIGEPFSSTVTLIEGNNRLLFLAMDTAGNRNVTIRNVIYDPTAPNVTVITPPGAKLTNITSINISGMAKDLTLSKVTVNGVDVTPDANGNYSLVVALKEGLNEIEVTGHDLAGHVTIVRRLVTLDTIPPPLQVFAPADGLLTNQPVQHVIGTTEVGAKVTIDTFNATVGTDGNFDYTITLREGINNIQVMAKDPAGNPTIVTRTVTLDTQPPTLKVSSPKKGLSVSEVELEVKGSVSDNIAVAKLTVNGKEVPVKNGKYSTTLALKAGSTKVIVQATDTAGNVATQEVKVSRGGLTMAETGLLIAAIILMVVGLIIGMLLAKNKMKKAPATEEPMDEPQSGQATSRFKDDDADTKIEEETEPESEDAEDEKAPEATTSKVDKSDEKVAPGPPAEASSEPAAVKKPDGQLAEVEMKAQDHGKTDKPQTPKADIDNILEKLKK